uniref:Uncharacterized protein n=1 Tax=Lutzomyia longipalpis TaxID=7200 RepID=A0A7G3B2H1_LUTLO
MKKMNQFPKATSANCVLLFAVCLTTLALCTAKHEEDSFVAQWAPVRNKRMNHHEKHENVIISHENELPKSLWSNLISPNEAQHDEKFKSATHGERIISNIQATTTGSAPLGDAPSIPPSRRRIKRMAEMNSAMPHSSRHSLHRRDVRRTETSQNLCSTEWCKCTGNEIRDVKCNLPSQPITFDKQYSIPKDARSLIVDLNTNTRLTVHRGFFQDNRINRISFRGPEKNSKAHVEFLSNALEGNRAPNPEIEIINCDTVVFKKGTFHGEINLNVAKCQNVIVSDGSLSQASFTATFDGIRDLRMNTNALNGGANSRIHIANSFIERFEKIGNTMKEIRITNSTIREIAANAFNFNELHSIVLEKSVIDKIETLAFTNGHSQSLQIIGCNITKIANQAFFGVAFDAMTFEGNTVKTIEENGISAASVNASISYNRIEKTGNNWLTITQFTNFDVNNNSFWEFRKLGTERSSKMERCSFFRNTIAHAMSNSMELPESCVIKDVFFNTTCTCNPQWLKNLMKNYIELEKNSFCSTDDSIRYCFNSSLIRASTYRREVCDDSPTLDCIKNQKEPKLEGNFIRPNDGDKNNGQVSILYYIAGGVTCIIVLIILIGILIVYCRKKGKRHDRAELITPTPEHSHHSVERAPPKSTRIFTPEDRLIINQTLERMKAKHPPEKYDHVFNYTQKLMNGSLTESEKVLTIGEVVQTLRECENSGEDFVAFTDILYKHLAPKDNNQNDPVYAEPNLAVSSDGEDRNTQLDLNHIYAEPHSVQQPLLNNEYAFPVDRNTETGLYTEPVVSPREPQRKLISPYAIGGTTVPHETGRTTPPNLPDVLSQSTAPSSSEPPLLPSGNVQRIANSFANNPNFHITRSPLTNRKIPKYTIPASKGGQMKSNSAERKHSGPSGLHKKDSASSDHSGGSDITVKMDDVIDYADA